MTLEFAGRTAGAACRIGSSWATSRGLRKEAGAAIAQPRLEITETITGRRSGR